MRPLLLTLLLFLVPAYGFAEEFCVKWVKVQSGDSCYKLRTDNALNETDFKALNPELDCNALMVGDEVCVGRGKNFDCTRKINIISGQTCWSLANDTAISVRRLQDMNPDMNCDSLQDGQEVCIEVGEKGNASTTPAPPAVPPSIPPRDFSKDQNFTCAENYTLQAGDLCWNIQHKFGLNGSDFARMNPALDCNKIQVGQSVCISLEGCRLRHVVLDGESCFFIGIAYKTTVTEIESANPGLKCAALQVGQKICVWPPNRTVNSYDATCTQNVTVKAGDSCWSITQSAGITVDELLLLNPTINCESLQIGYVLCARAGSSQSCSAYHRIAPGEDCQYVAGVERIPLSHLHELNPSVDCDKLQQYSQVCIGRGSFAPSSCLEHVRVLTDTETCDTVATMFGASTTFSLVCKVGFTGTANIVSTTEDLMASLKIAAPGLLKAYEAYKASPSATNNDRLYLELTNNIPKKEVYAVIKKLYSSNANIKALMDAGATENRNESCMGVRESALSATTKACFCNGIELITYCQALAVREFYEHVKNNPAARSKRGILPGFGCEVDLPFGNEGKFKQANKFMSNCFGGGCKIPFPTPPILEFAIAGEVCLPYISTLQTNLKFCENANCREGKKLDAYFLKQLIDRTATVKASVCVIGSDFLSDVMKSLKGGGMGLCIDIVRITYTPFVGKLDVGMELSFFSIIRVKGGAMIKIHELPHGQMCDMQEFACQDYCLWRRFDSDNGAAYGYISVILAKIWGFDGIKLDEIKINQLKLAGCAPKEEVSILWQNERKCDDGSTVWVQCESGDDKMKYTLVPKDRSGLSFRPWWRTLFYIRFVQIYPDGSEQMIDFDVYGGDSNNNARNGNFYYAVRDDGVYYGTKADQINEKKGSWDRTCEKFKDDEPTGTSSVPAAACGKRIVGYYTGWGEREVSIEQLKKLTHVIFAFVATMEDGTIGFGAVSEGDSSADAIKKAENRFFDLKKKARAANAGVRMLFAVGGWENSEYFSGIAGDEGKRKHFIDSIVGFLKNTGIDGVDIDWEYPVTGGAHEGVPADKDNYVTLLKELRERLNAFQKESGRETPYEISLASAAGEWTIRPGYDLTGILKYADFINVMTYDYYGAWGSKWGAYTGPPSPLFYGSPKGFSGKLNADFTMKYYTCRSQQPSLLNMGVPFYGRYWDNVGGAIGEDEMWRTAEAVGGTFAGGYSAWRDMAKNGWNIAQAKIHLQTKAPYIWNAGARKFLGFENPETLKYKADYAMAMNLGGLMIWAIDLDDDADTMLSVVSSADLCAGGSGDDIKYECVPIDDVRWWNPENSDAATQGQCGKYAPLINGYYPVCDPDDPGYACCSPAGFCGSGEDFCLCDDCVDYGSSPRKILDEPTKPTKPITWHTKEGHRGKCGKGADLINGQPATCNPDSLKPCCSNGFFCGSGKEFCECNGCIDYRKT